MSIIDKPSLSLRTPRSQIPYNFKGAEIEMVMNRFFFISPFENKSKAERLKKLADIKVKEQREKLDDEGFLTTVRTVKASKFGGKFVVVYRSDKRIDKLVEQIREKERLQIQKTMKLKPKGKKFKPISQYRQEEERELKRLNGLVNKWNSLKSII